MRKSLSKGIKDAQARPIKGAKPGDTVYIWFSNSLWGTEKFIGTVLVVHATVHGSVVLVQNKNHYQWKSGTPYNPPKGIYTAGPVVALWISECGNSGVIANTYPNCGKPMDSDYVVAKGMLDALEAQRERDAETCWAC